MSEKIIGTGQITEIYEDGGFGADFKTKFNEGWTEFPAVINKNNVYIELWDTFEIHFDLDDPEGTYEFFNTTDREEKERRAEKAAEDAKEICKILERMAKKGQLS